MATTKEDNDGIVNPQGLVMAGAGAAFLAFVPISSFMTKPDGLIQKIIEAAVRIVPGTANIPKERIIPALSALYIFATFAGSGAASAAGQAASRRDGLDNNHPRQHINSLVGLPLRLRSAHYNLMEMFPGFALAAGLTQALAPGNQQLINLLGLHVIAKIFIYYPCYLLNIAPPRTLSHFLATGSVINVAYRLALGAS